MGFIYLILNQINGKYYIGSTTNWKKRKRSHFKQLRKGIHHSLYLQRAFNKYGENNFIFILIETCYFNPQIREQGLLDSLNIANDSYNISLAASGGNTFSNNPNKEIIRKKLIENLRPCWANSLHLFASDNPNWKGGKNKCKCCKEISKNAFTCSKCRDRTKACNPFFGKKHSQKTKDNLSKIKLGSLNLAQSKEISVNGIVYKSLSEASNALRIHITTLSYRARSTNPKFSNIFYVS